MKLRLAMLVSVVALTACLPGHPVNRQQAELMATRVETSVQADQSEAKLMTWSEWRRLGPAVSDSNRGPNLWPFYLVWAVALRDRNGGDGMVVVLDAITGSEVLATGGPWRWPPYWEQLPNRA